MILTDELLPSSIKRADEKGIPRVDNRAILNGILWVMRTGAPWLDYGNISVYVIVRYLWPGTQPSSGQKSLVVIK
jgi:hypothetical protein